MEINELCQSHRHNIYLVKSDINVMLIIKPRSIIIEYSSDYIPIKNIGTLVNFAVQTKSSIFFT